MLIATSTVFGKAKFNQINKKSPGLLARGYFFI